MAFVKGRGVTVAVQLTEGSPITITDITQASPGVATSTSHAQPDGTVGVLTSVEGMVQLNGQAVRVDLSDSPMTNSFDLQGLNTTNYSAFTGTCTFTPIATWATLSECDQYDIGGGASDKIDVTCLTDVVKQEEAGLLPSQSVTLNIKATDTPSQALGIIEAAAQAGESIAFRITLPNGAVRIFAGEPSIPGETVNTGAVGTGSLSVAVKGYVLKLAA
jgi:hypothetical protein